MFRDHQCINNSNFLLSPDFVKVGYRGKEGGRRFGLVNVHMIEFMLRDRG